jgi:hypothetical protein
MLLALPKVRMIMLEPVPMVRCRLDGPEDATAAALRYVPLAEFELWRHLMEGRHHRRVTVEAVSFWLAEDAAHWNSGFAAEELEPVLRVQLEVPRGEGVSVPMERFFPAETYPKAQEALLSHYAGENRPRRVSATPGYFVPPEVRKPEPILSVA